MQRSSSTNLKELKSIFEQIQQKQKGESEREEIQKRKGISTDAKGKKGSPKEGSFDGSYSSLPLTTQNSTQTRISEHENFMNGTTSHNLRSSSSNEEILKEEKSNPPILRRSDNSNSSYGSVESNGIPSEILRLLEQQQKEITSLKNKLESNESEKKQITKDYEIQLQELRPHKIEASQLKMEKELLQQQIYYLQLQLQNQQKLIDDKKKEEEASQANNTTEKLKSKLKKQKERNEKLSSNLEASNSLIQTLQITVTQLQEVVTKRDQQLDEQKALVTKYQKIARQRRKQIEGLQLELDSHGGPPSSDHTVEIDSDVPSQQDGQASDTSVREEKIDHTKNDAVLTSAKPTPLHRSSSAKSADELPGMQTLQRTASGGSHKRNKSSDVVHEVATPQRKSSTWGKSAMEHFSKSVSDIPTTTPSPTKDDKHRSYTGKDFDNLRALVNKQHSSGSIVTMQSGNDQVYTISLTVSAPELTLTTVVASNWTVGETIQRLTKKFPGKTENFALFVKCGKQSSYMMLENSKLISDYKKLLDEAKNTLKFANPATFDGRGGKYLRGKSKSFVEDVFHKKNSMLAIPTESVHDAIRRQDIDQLESLLILPTGNSTSNSYSKEQLEYVKTQLYAFDSNGQPSLHLAIGCNSPKIVQLFLMFWLHYQLDINLRDRYGWTALHCACSLSHGTENDDEILRLLLQYPGISADVQNDDKNHPLHYFCERFRTPTCEKVGEMLIQKSPSSVNSRNKNGETPLHKSVFNPGVRMIMVKLLLRHGTDVNLPNSIGGETVLHYAVHLQRKDLLKVLLYAGADIHVKDTRNSQTPYELAVQLNQPEIANVLKRAQDLYKWLSDQQLTEYFVMFLREDLYLDVLAQLSMDENNALDKLFKKLKIDAVGVRIKIKKACEGLRDKHQKKMFDSRLKKVSLRRKPSYDFSPEHRQRMDTVKNEIMSSDNDSQWLIDYHALEFIKELGSGSFAKVFKGLYKGEKVAIKVMKASGNDVIKEFKKEFMIMSRVQCPEIVRFFGASLNGPRICLVIEYCSKGSLLEVMKNPSSSIDWERAIKFFLQMSKGMETLHNWNPPIYHRDLKTGNLLLDYNWDLKLCDMGLARFNNKQSEDTMTKMCGTYNYLAPEVFYGKRFTDKADVFSMGIILWEISHRVITGNHSLPYVNEYPDLKLDFQIAVHVAEKGIRPTLPPSCPAILGNFIKQCWHPDKESRPTATAMVEFFTALEQNYRSNTNVWEDSIEAYKADIQVNHRS